MLRRLIMVHKRAVKLSLIREYSLHKGKRKGGGSITLQTNRLSTLESVVLIHLHQQQIQWSQVRK